MSIILSHFNTRIGPRIFLSAPRSLNSEIFKTTIPPLMDLYDGFFIHIFEDYKCANLPFYIENEENLRGRQELLLLSFIMDLNNDLNVEMAKEILEQIVSEIKDVKDVYKAFRSNDINANNRPFFKIQEIINKSYNTIRPTIEALKKAEVKYQTLFNSARDAILLIDRDSTKIIDVNQECINLLSKKKENIIGENFEDIFQIKGNSSLFNELIKLCTNNKRDYITFSYKSPIKTLVHVELNASQIQIADKVVIQCIMRDVSQRVESEEKLRESEEKYRLITENAYDLIAVLNMKLEHDFINESRYKEILGYSKEDIIGKSVLGFMHPEDIKKAILNRKIALKGDQPPGSTVRIKDKDGRWKWVEARSRTFKDSNGDLKGITIARDITERMKFEQKMNEALDLSDFLKNLLAHDMGNVLNNIKASTQLMQISKDKPLNSINLEELFHTIENQLERGKSLISNVRKFSELDDLDATTKIIDAKLLIEEGIELIKVRFQGKNIEIKSEIPNQTLKIIGGDLLIDAFENVLLNSVIHNNKENIQIWLKVKKIQENGINYVRIEFIDNGIGITDERKDLIFKRGYKKDRNRQTH